MSGYTMEDKPLDPNFVPPEQPEATTGTPDEAAQEETWAGPSREEWEQSQQVNQYIMEQLQQAVSQLNPNQPQLDPFNENFQQQLDAYINERISPYQQITQEMTYAEAEERAQDILSDYQSQHGEFVDPDSMKIARAMADQFLADEEQKYGFGPKAAEAALERGYQYAKEREDRLSQLAVERHLNQLKTLGGATREPGTVTTQASQTTTLPPGGDEFSVLRAYGGMGR